MVGKWKRRKLEIAKALDVQLPQTLSPKLGGKRVITGPAERGGAGQGQVGGGAARLRRLVSRQAPRRGSAGARTPGRPCGRWPPVTCWSPAKSSAPAKPGGSAGRTARAGPAGNPAALLRSPPPAARPPWPPCCCGSDACRDPEAIGERREGIPRSLTGWIYWRHRHWETGRRTLSPGFFLGRARPNLSYSKPQSFGNTAQA